MHALVNPLRVQLLNTLGLGQGPVVYWMNRDQRVHDNWALLYAQQRALDLQKPLIVLFCLRSNFKGATNRQYSFMLKGLECVEAELDRLNIPFFLLIGAPEKEALKFAQSIDAGAFITDFSPLRSHRNNVAVLQEKLACSLYVVDAHNIVPCWVASHKLEYGARTLRSKIHKNLAEFLTDFPVVKKHQFILNKKYKRIDWQEVYASLDVDMMVNPVNWIKPGEKEAYKVLQKFIVNKLATYENKRNDPTEDGQSNLSPYLHFGHISAQRVAFEVCKHNPHADSTKSFLEELVVRRELADNFCFYNEHYDSFEGFAGWAQISLNAHRKDKREYVYTLKQFEHAQTHDRLWNAAQIEMANTGKMHGYMRMYWAKKILEWTESPEQAMKIAIYLNDKYELDGNDPNGYVGIAWSIGGVHDRAWFERLVFGKVRYMNYNGCKRKFDVDVYVSKNTTIMLHSR